MNIQFLKIGNYISEYTEEKITVFHPAILVEKNNKYYCFSFTHDKNYAIEGKENKYSCLFLNDFSTTKIGDNKTLEETKKYYENILKNEVKVDKILEAKKHLRGLQYYGMDYVCPHKTDNSYSYLSQEVPIFYSRKEFSFYKIPISFKQCSCEKDYLSFEADKEKFLKFLSITKMALLSNVLYKYEPSSKNDFIEIQKERFTFIERIDLAFEIENEIKWQNHESKLEKIEFLDKIIENNINKKGTPIIEKIENYKDELIIQKIYNKEQKGELYIKNKDDFKAQINNYKIDKNKIDILFNKFCELSENYEKNNDVVE